MHSAEPRPAEDPDLRTGWQPPEKVCSAAVSFMPPHPHPRPRQLKVMVEALLESTRPAQVCSGLLAKGTKPGQIRSRVVWARDRVGTLTPGHSREGWGPASRLLALTREPVAQGKKSKHTITVTPQGWLPFCPP